MPLRSTSSSDGMINDDSIEQLYKELQYEAVEDFRDKKEISPLKATSEFQTTEVAQ